MYDLVAMGELLIDMTPTRLSGQDQLCFERNPGGAPANVSAAMAKWGRRSAFIGKVGRDPFGFYLQEVMADHGVDVQGLRLSEREATTLAFVHLNDDGDRSFSFYRRFGADVMLSPEEVDLDVIAQARLFHYGSLSLTDEPVRSATWTAVRHAQAHQIPVAYDPNWRPPLWQSPEEGRAMMTEGLRFADIVKVSEEELALLSGTDDLEAGSLALCRTHAISLLCVTMGPQGCYYRRGEESGFVPGFSVRSIDTTGAGDAFWAAVLYRITEEEDPLRLVQQISVTGLETALRFANRVGARVTEKKGAIPALPDQNELNAFESNVP